MNHEAFTETIDAHLAAADGELTRRSTVIDGLLDLRAEAAADSDLVAEIDGCLGAAPGVSVTPTKWWMAELRRLRAVASDVAVAAPA